MQEIFNPEEAAKRLKVTPYTLCKWLRQGLLQGARTPAGWRITATDLQAFLNSQRLSRPTETTL